MSEQIFDITVIGGGPVGLFAAFYGGMRQSTVKIIESLHALGGQLTALYPEKFIYDIAGVPKIRAKDLVTSLTEQMEQFQPTICSGQTAQTIEKLEDGSFVITTDKEVHYSKTIIITAGNGFFQPRRLNLENDNLFDKNIHYFVNDLLRFSNKKVAIFGGGDSAVDWSLMLEPIAKEVHLIHRRDQFRAHENSVEKLNNSHVNVLTPYAPVQLIGTDDKVTQIIIEHTKTKEEKTIDVDDVIVNYGIVSSLGPIKEWGLEIDRNSIVVNSKMETSIPGIYAAGDICTYEGKTNLIASGFGEVPTAVTYAKAYIDPTAKMHTVHSTNIFK